jgi:UDP-MurNAc hydroxylase
MNLTFIASSTTIVSHKNTKILTDPWVIGKPFFGSWSHYPPVENKSEKLNDVNYIYISHVHADHADEETLKSINDDIPIIIYQFDSPALKNRLKGYGKTVIELKHGEEFHCGDGLYIKIFIADDCNPEICYSHFGCGKMETKYRSSTIDTMAVFYNESETILNTNDCPFSLAEKTVDRILKSHPKINLLLTGYSGAGAYPQCYEHYSDEEKLGLHGDRYRKLNLDNGMNFIKKVNPISYMPFAGTYTLAGKASKLEKFKGVHTVEYALDYFKRNHKSHGFLLNSWETFDLTTLQQTSEYIPVNYEERDKYIEEVLSKVTYTYEDNPKPELSDILNLIPGAFERFDKKRKEMEFESNTSVYIYLPENKMLKLPFNGKPYEIINESEFDRKDYVTYRLDEKLLKMILMGPKYAHWNYCEGGNHIMFSRDPDIYQRAVSYCMNYFHN